jgi:acetoin utilization deacetylase AcuC-like enzyme
LAESQGFSWDAGLLPMVLASNGGVVEAALAALQNGLAGSLSSGLHHARHQRGAGFCTFNGLAIAAQAALESGARSVLILDLDAHCGGGTHSLIMDDSRIWQLDVSVSSFDSYQPSERTSLTILSDAERYLPLIENQLKELGSRTPKFDLCLYNAGMDPSEDCQIGGLNGITREVLAERERIVFAWCRAQGVPVAFVLAGGYIGSKLSESALVELHRLTISSAARMSA